MTVLCLRDVSGSNGGYIISRLAFWCLFGGIMIGFAGMVILAAIVFETQRQEPATWSASFMVLLPRASLVVVVELLSFFLLKTYERSRQEFRYYHNEMTNIEMKCCGLELAAQLTDPQALQGAVAVAVSTERNFRLAKDET